MWSLYIEKLLMLFPTLEADYDAWLVRNMDRETYSDRLHKLQYLKPQVPKESEPAVVYPPPLVPERKGDGEP